MIVGAGIEDMETMERIFSASNEVARVTRYASSFSRRLWVIMHYKQWDKDKYMNLGRMLVDNYRQALKIIADESDELREAMAAARVLPAAVEGDYHEARGKLELDEARESGSRYGAIFG